MAMERTYIMLKPDCVKRGLMGEVISRIERKNYKIIDAKMMMLDEPILREHYAHLSLIHISWQSLCSGRWPDGGD